MYNLILATEFSNVTETTIDEAIVVTAVGISVVFLVMGLLAIVFTYIGKLLSADLKLKKAANVVTNSTENPIKLSGKMTAETAAAISAAIYQYLNEAKDEENAIVTIIRSPKAYSPWSSKIYGTHKSVFNSGRR